MHILKNEVCQNNADLRYQIAKAMIVCNTLHSLENAMAALKHFAVSSEETLLVISSGLKFNQERVLQESMKKKWLYRYTPHFLPENTFLSTTFFSNFIRTQAFAKFFSRVRKNRQAPLQLLIVALYNNPVDQTAINVIPHERFILVDDGNKTTEIARLRAQELCEGFRRTYTKRKHLGLKGSIKLFLLRSFGGVRDYGSKSITFFTKHHGLQIQERDNLVQQTVSIFPGREVNWGSVHFLGLPVFDRKIISVDSYEQLLRFVAHLYHGKKISYFLHPGERMTSPTFLKACLPGVKIEPYTKPYETKIRELQVVPEVIITCYSSVLMNLVTCENLSSRLESIILPSSLILDRIRRERVREIYKNIARYPEIIMLPVVFESLQEHSP